MRKAFKYRIYLTNGQRRILNTTLEACRWVYNQTLAARRTADAQGISLFWYETKARLPSWKEARPKMLKSGMKTGIARMHWRTSMSG